MLNYMLFKHFTGIHKAQNSRIKTKKSTRQKFSRPFHQIYPNRQLML